MIQEGAILNGAVFTGAAELIIRGKVNGDLYVAAGKVTIENTVNGNIKAHTGRLTILGEGKVNGDLSYASDKALSKEELARVTGSVDFKKKNMAIVFPKENVKNNKKEQIKSKALKRIN